MKLSLVKFVLSSLSVTLCISASCIMRKHEAVSDVSQIDAGRLIGWEGFSWPLMHVRPDASTWCKCRDYLAVGSSPHIGVDILSPKGKDTIAVALSDGVVESYTLDKNTSCGYRAQFRDRAGALWHYLHLDAPSEAFRRLPRRVGNGEIISYITTFPTGNCGTGSPHLHLERRTAGAHGGAPQQNSCAKNQYQPKDCNFDPIFNPALLRNAISQDRRPSEEEQRILREQAQRVRNPENNYRGPPVFNEPNVAANCDPSSVDYLKRVDIEHELRHGNFVPLAQRDYRHSLEVFYNVKDGPYIDLQTVLMSKSRDENRNRRTNFENVCEPNLPCILNADLYFRRGSQWFKLLYPLMVEESPRISRRMQVCAPKGASDYAMRISVLDIETNRVSDHLIEDRLIER